MNKNELAQLVKQQLHLLKVCPLIKEDELVINNEDLPKVVVKLDAITDVLKLGNKAIDSVLKERKKCLKI